MRELRLQTLSEPGSLVHIREIVCAFMTDAGLDAERTAEAVLAVHEACANVCLHAYEEGETGPLGIEASVAGDRLEITVWDGGKPAIRRPRSQPGAGFGRKLIEAFSDEHAVEGPGEHGTRVRMTFTLTEPGR